VERANGHCLYNLYYLQVQRFLRVVKRVNGYCLYYFLYDLQVQRYLRVVERANGYYLFRWGDALVHTMVSLLALALAWREGGGSKQRRKQRHGRASTQVLVGHSQCARQAEDQQTMRKRVSELRTHQCQ